MLSARRFPLVHLLAILALALTIGAPVDASARSDSRPGPSQTGRYIVVVDGADPASVAADHGVAPAHVYRHAIRGFAAGMSQRKAASLARDGRVAFVEPETIERIQWQ
jgi:hypothetical protein